MTTCSMEHSQSFSPFSGAPSEFYMYLHRFLHYENVSPRRAKWPLLQNQKHNQRRLQGVTPCVLILTPTKIQRVVENEPRVTEAKLRLLLLSQRQAKGEGAQKKMRKSRPKTGSASEEGEDRSTRKPCRKVSTTSCTSKSKTR